MTIWLLAFEIEAEILIIFHFFHLDNLKFNNLIYDVLFGLN